MALVAEPEILFEGGGDPATGDLGTAGDLTAAGAAAEASDLPAAGAALDEETASAGGEEAETEAAAGDGDAQSGGGAEGATKEEGRGGSAAAGGGAAAEWGESVGQNSAHHVLDGLLAAGGGALGRGGKGRRSDRIETLLQLSLDEAAALQQGRQHEEQQHRSRRERGATRKKEFFALDATVARDSNVTGAGAAAGGRSGKNFELKVQEKLTMSLEDLIMRQQQQQQQKQPQRKGRRRQHTSQLWKAEAEEDLFEEEEEEDVGEEVRGAAAAGAWPPSSQQELRSRYGQRLTQQQQQLQRHWLTSRDMYGAWHHRHSSRREMEEDEEVRGKWITRGGRNVLSRGPYYVGEHVQLAAAFPYHFRAAAGEDLHLMRASAEADGSSGGGSLKIRRKGRRFSSGDAAAASASHLRSRAASGFWLEAGPPTRSNGSSSRTHSFAVDASLSRSGHSLLQQQDSGRQVIAAADEPGAGWMRADARAEKAAGEDGSDDDQDDPAAASWLRAFRRAVLLPLHVGACGWKHLVDVKPDQQESLAAFILYSGTGQLQKTDIYAFFKPLSPRLVTQLFPPCFFIISFPSAAAAEAALQQRSQSCCHVLAVMHQRLRELQEEKKQQEQQPSHKAEVRKKKQQLQYGERKGDGEERRRQDEKEETQQQQPQEGTKEEQQQQQGDEEDVDMDGAAGSGERSRPGETSTSRSNHKAVEAAAADGVTELQQRQVEGQWQSSRRNTSGSREDNDNGTRSGKKEEARETAASGLSVYTEGSKAWTLQQAGSFLDDEEREIFLLQLEKWRRTAPIPLLGGGAGSAARVLMRRATVEELRACAASISLYMPAEAECLIAAAAPRRVCLSQSAAAAALIEPSPAAAAATDAATSAGTAPPVGVQGGTAIRRGRVLLAPAAGAGAAAASDLHSAPSTWRRNAGVWLGNSLWNPATTISSGGSAAPAGGGAETAARVLPSLQLLRRQRQQQQRFAFPADLFSAAAAFAAPAGGSAGLPWRIGDNVGAKGGNNAETSAGVEENELKQDESLLRSCGGDFRTRILQGRPVLVGEGVGGAPAPERGRVREGGGFNRDSPEVIEIDSPDEEEVATGAGIRKGAAADDALSETKGEAGMRGGSRMVYEGKSSDAGMTLRGHVEKRRVINGEKEEDGQWTEEEPRRPEGEEAEQRDRKKEGAEGEKRGAVEERACRKRGEQRCQQSSSAGAEWVGRRGMYEDERGRGGAGTAAAGRGSREQEEWDEQEAAGRVSDEERLRRRERNSYLMKKASRHVLEREEAAAAAAEGGSGGSHRYAGGSAADVAHRERLRRRRSSSRRRRGRSRSRSSSYRRRSPYGGSSALLSGYQDRAPLDGTREPDGYANSSSIRYIGRIPERAAHAAPVYTWQEGEDGGYSWSHHGRYTRGVEAHVPSEISTNGSSSCRRLERVEEVTSSSTGSKVRRDSYGRALHPVAAAGGGGDWAVVGKWKQQQRRERRRDSSSERDRVAASGGGLHRRKTLRDEDEERAEDDYARHINRTNRENRGVGDGIREPGSGHRRSENSAAPAEKKSKGRGFTYAHSRKSMVADRHSHSTSKRRPPGPPQSK